MMCQGIPVTRAMPLWQQSLSQHTTEGEVLEAPDTFTSPRLQLSQKMTWSLETSMERNRVAENHPHAAETKTSVDIQTDVKSPAF